MGLFEKAFWLWAAARLVEWPKARRPKRKATYWDAAIGFVVFMLFYMFCC